MNKLITDSGVSRFWSNFKNWAAGLYTPKTRKVNKKPLNADVVLTGQNIEMDYENAEYVWNADLPAPSVASDIKYQKEKHLPLSAGMAAPMTGNLTIKKNASAKFINSNNEAISCQDKNGTRITDLRFYGGARLLTYALSPSAATSKPSFQVGASGYNNLNYTNTNFITTNRKSTTSANAGFTFTRLGDGGFRAKFLMVDSSDFTKEVSSEDITENSTYYLPDDSGTLMSTQSTSVKGDCSADTTGYFTINDIQKVGPFVCIRITFKDAAGSVLNATSSEMVPAQYRPTHTIALTPRAANIGTVSSCSMTTAGKFSVRIAAKGTGSFEFYTIYYVG